ncbi:MULTISPECIES: hypothetical protein [unclassified Bradyrhizobium]|uniref:hypothetical protein n=1 Tax=unclassified Bradyrhizobium TaxID=2631580 RepID=UPI0028E2D703|nr:MULTISPECIES: hypothetical protein [unclassified Bradyrhizobium]
MVGKISDDPDIGTPAGTELVPVVSGGVNKRTTISAIANFALASFAGAVQALTNKTINAASNTISNLALSMFASGVVDTDGTLAANSDTRVATQKAVKTYADQLIAANDAMVFKGVIDCSTNPNYPAADRGWTYKVSIAGKIGGASGINVEVGDSLICITDGAASGNQATVGAAWTIIQVNIDGAVTGPASSTDGNFALFNGTSGKLLKDSGVAIASATEYKVGTASKLIDASVRVNTPCFSAHKNGTDQTGIADSTFTQVTFPTEVYDVGNYFAANAWTPPAGKVHLDAAVFISATVTTGAQIAITLYKNGAGFKQGNWPLSSLLGGGAGFIGCDDIANGADVYTVQVYVDTSSGTATISGNSVLTFFSGHWICP